tara:strand:+ start:232 stop:414 length:183 start_codon:yes stop_codon:yes gene_type:complete
VYNQAQMPNKHILLHASFVESLKFWQFVFPEVNCQISVATPTLILEIGIVGSLFYAVKVL